jgi:urease accessory protein
MIRLSTLILVVLSRRQIARHPYLTRARIDFDAEQSTLGARMQAARYPLSAAVLLAAGPALAHAGGTNAAGFVAGFVHPVSGLDHLFAMVSIGIWAAELGAPAIWLLPIAFPLIMAVGGTLGVVGVPLPAAESLVALSVLALGTLVAGAWRVPFIAALAVVAVFALAHGHMHGAELPASADALAFTVGFVVSTGLLHLVGILIGLLVRWPSGLVAIRACGLLVALAGCYFLYEHGST